MTLFIFDISNMYVSSMDYGFLSLFVVPHHLETAMIDQTIRLLSSF